MGTKLKANAEYRNDARGLYYRVGDVFTVTDEMATYLFADAPGCFELFTEPPVKAVTAPRVDKMTRSPKAKK